MTTNCHNFAISRRDAPEVCQNPSPRKEGVGNAGCLLHPQPRVQSVESTRVVATGTAGSPGAPARNGFNGFLRALPGDRLVVTVACGLRFLSLPGRADKTPLSLTPAPGRQDHTTSPSAATSLVCARSDRSRKNPPCDPIARSTLPRPPHPTPRP
jgi:hypothetical protein